MGIIRSRNPTGIFNAIFGRKEAAEYPAEKSRIEMVTMEGDTYLEWNGKLYQSDIVRSCIKRQITAVGELVGKHIRETELDGKKDLKVNPEAYMKFLLAEPNDKMTAQQFQEKMAAQLILNNNAFALIIRDQNGYPVELYPVPAILAQAVYDKNGNLYIKFTYKNGRMNIFAYENLIHLKQDCYDSEIFGSSPAAALAPLMECVSVIDQGIVKAIKNSGVIRWLLKFTTSLRPEDIEKNTKAFVQSYLNYESDTFGAAGIDNKVDAKQIEPKDYVPNTSATKEIKQRIYDFFGTNEKIVQAKYNEDEWQAFYESNIEPIAVQMGQVYSKRLFTRRERAFGNKIVFEAFNLNSASHKTKLDMVQMVDRGGLTVNEWRAMFNLAPIPGGDVPIRRLDTAVVDMIDGLIDKINDRNYPEIVDLIKRLVDKGGEINAEIEYTRNNYSEQPETCV